MFEDSMVTLMVMLLLCFVGMLVMFLFVIRSNTVLDASIKESTRQMQAHLADIERQLMEINYTSRNSGKAPSPAMEGDISSLLGSIGETSEALRRSKNFSDDFASSFSGQRAGSSSLGDDGLPNLSLAAEFGPTVK